MTQARGQVQIFNQDDGKAYSIRFKLNGVVTNVLNFDTVKALEGQDVTLEADFLLNGEPFTAGSCSMGCYDAHGYLMGSEVTGTSSDSLVLDGGSLYLSEDCKTILCSFAKNGTTLCTSSIGVIRNGSTVKSVAYKVINNVGANSSLNWDTAATSSTYPTVKPDKGKYCYVMTIVTYTDGNSTETVSSSYTPIDGTSVTTTTSVTYARSRTNVQPTNFPLTSVPSDLALGEYLWSKTSVTYKGANTTSTTSIAVTRIGKDGEKGYSLHVLYSDVDRPIETSHISATMQSGYDNMYVYSDQSEDDDTTKGVGQTFKKIKGEKGNSYAIRFKLNGGVVDVLNYDDVKALEDSEVKLEVDVTCDGSAYNVHRMVLNCYDARGYALCDSIDETSDGAGVYGPVSLYISDCLKQITAVAYDTAGTIIATKSIAVICDVRSYGLVRMEGTHMTVKPDSTGAANFVLSGSVSYKVSKTIGSASPTHPEITSMTVYTDESPKQQWSWAPDESDTPHTVAEISNIIGSLHYTASKRPPSCVNVSIVCEGRTLKDTIPVTMEAGVAIDIDQKIGKLSSTVASGSDRISTLEQTGTKISAKVAALGGRNLLVDSEFNTAVNNKITRSGKRYREVWIEPKYSGESTYTAPTLSSGQENGITAQGVNAVKAVSTTDKMALVRWYVPVRGGATYTASVSVMSPDATKTAARSYCLEAIACNDDLSRDKSAGSARDQKILMTGVWLRLTCTLTMPSDHPYLEFCFWAKNSGTVYFRQPQLEEGGEATEWSRTRDTELMNDRLMATGIDIEHKKVTLTSDNVYVRNNSGEKTAVLNQDGKLNVSMIDTDSLVALNIETKDTGKGHTEIHDNTSIWYQYNGKKGIEIMYDSAGFPHFIFYNANGAKVYDLGYNGLQELLQGYIAASIDNVSMVNISATANTVNAFKALSGNTGALVGQYHCGFTQGSDGSRIYVIQTSDYTSLDGKYIKGYPKVDEKGQDMMGLQKMKATGYFMDIFELENGEKQYPVLTKSTTSSTTESTHQVKSPDGISHNALGHVKGTYCKEIPCRHYEDGILIASGFVRASINYDGTPYTYDGKAVIDVSENCYYTYVEKVTALVDVSGNPLASTYAYLWSYSLGNINS